MKSNKKETALKIFQEQTVRTHWDEEQEKWFFSIIDVIAILANNPRPRKYWSDLKKKLKDEGSELSENIGQLKMFAQDGKMRLTDIADTELQRVYNSWQIKRMTKFFSVNSFA